MSLGKCFASGLSTELARLLINQTMKTEHSRVL